MSTSVKQMSLVDLMPLSKDNPDNRCVGNSHLRIYTEERSIACSYSLIWKDRGETKGEEEKREMKRE